MILRGLFMIWCSPRPIDAIDAIQTDHRKWQIGAAVIQAESKTKTGWKK